MPARVAFRGLKYTQYLLRLDRYRHCLSVGFENKLFDNDVTAVGGGAQLVADVRSFPVVLSYGGEYPLFKGLASFSVSYARNTSHGGHNSQTNDDNSRFLGFVDAGKVWNTHYRAAGLVGDDFVATVGVGLRWQPGRQVNVAVDVGHVLEGTANTGDGHQQVHANVTVRF